MYLVYSTPFEDDKIDVLGIAETHDEAKDILENSVRDFIFEEEGRKKWEKVFIQDVEMLKNESVKDGLYLENMGDKMIVYDKKTILEFGMIRATQTVKINKIKFYNISQFDKSKVVINPNINLNPQHYTKEKKIEQTKIVKAKQSIIDQIKNKDYKLKPVTPLKSISENQLENDLFVLT